MNENRKHAHFLLGLAAITLTCLAGFFLWFLSSATVASVENAENSSNRNPGEVEPSVSNDTDRGASDPEKPVSFRFAQYDRRPSGYVGTAACAECHADQHQSYLHTHHSRSLREVDLEKEGHGQTLVHRLSKRSYDVFAKDGRLWHRQWRHFSEAPNDRMPVGELPVCYVMGSGSFGKGYLLSDGDYLLQSPVTWYAGSDDLDMAPGYDRVYHVGFTRVITAECMFCHAGLLTQRDDNPNHLAIHELSIGCERCHGPGEAHAKLYRDIQSGVLEASSKDHIDPKIVHPGKLDRRRSESICGQCHLHGDIVVHPPGRQIWDFVPGEDFAETRLHFKHDKAGDLKDSFTGHFDQMWQSKCYLESDTLTCLTCHNPHQAEPIADLDEWRRQQCNACHAATDSTCGLALDKRIKQADNRCTVCHMPSIKADVPHTSTTSHLIAVYDAGQPRGLQAADAKAMRRVQIAPAISDQLLSRADAVAKAAWAVDQAREGEYGALDSVVLDVDLDEALRGDPADAYIHSLLSRMNRLRADRMAATATPENRTDLDELWNKVLVNANRALQLDERPDDSREIALESLGNYQMRNGDYAAAARSLRELAQNRRSAVDWYNLGLCFGKLQRLSDAELAFREAIRLDGTYVAPYRSLSILYRSVNPAASQQFAAIAQRLMSQ